jgi:hypothetical protein
MASASEKALLSLLSCELFQQPISSPSIADYYSLLSDATRHCVTALLYPTLKQQSDIPAEFLTQVRRAALYSAKSFDATLRCQAEVIDLLNVHGIPCAVLKGMSVACHYPHPELRLPGDIDILVEEDNLQAASDAFASAGWTYSHTTDLHVCYSKDGAEVEIHSAVSRFPDEEKGNFTRHFMADALQHTETVRLHGVTFPALSGVYQLIALLAHMERHLASSGIGLRQLCDWAVTVHAQRESIGESELAVLDQCGLLQFAKVATKTCVKYLGLPTLPWCEDAEDDLCDALMSDILDAGNFQTQNTRHLSNVLTDTSYDADGKKPSTVRNYFHYIRKRTQKEHPWAKSSVWVLVFSVYYPIRWIVCMLPEKSKRKRMGRALQAAKEREKLMWGLKVYK